MIVLRGAKMLLMAAMGLFFTVVVFNNVTDFDSNYQFVRHVLMMDTTFPGNHGMWRAIDVPMVHTAFYLGIIGWETLNAVLCWWAAVAMGRSLRGPAAGFTRATMIGVAALTAGLLQWMVAFLTVGAEWFLMWQSRLWNGQEAAARMFMVEGIVLLVLLAKEP
jgi:predicted small integral membrane protein